MSGTQKVHKCFVLTQDVKLEFVRYTNMKKHSWMVGLVVMAVLSVACFVFWRQANIERHAMVSLCQASVCQSLENFQEYSSKGDDYLYIYGVAEFRSFMNAYLCLNDNPGDSDYLYCNIIYGEMVLNPEKVQENIQDVIGALAILAEDYTDPNGYIRLNELGNLLRYGEE